MYIAIGLTNISDGLHGLGVIIQHRVANWVSLVAQQRVTVNWVCFVKQRRVANWVCLVAQLACNSKLDLFC